MKTLKKNRSHRMDSTRLCVGDPVIVLQGVDKGKVGKVLRFSKNEKNRCKVVVDGVNEKVKHQKARQQDQTAGIIKKNMPIDISNVAYYLSSHKRATKIGYKCVDIKGEDSSDSSAQKVRYAKATGQVIERSVSE